MTICNVEGLDASELLAEEGCIFSAALPEHVSDLIVASDVAIRCLLRHNLAHARLDHILVLAEGQEDGADISTLHVSQLCPVSLFFG